jgi:hypothetical protein
METTLPVPSEVPVKLTKSGKPRKPFVMTPARQAAFEKCRLARLAKRAEARAQVADPETVQRAKEQAQRIDDAMNVTSPPAPAPLAPKPVAKKSQPALKEKKIPQRKNTPKRSMLEVERDPNPIVSTDVDTDEDPEEEAEETHPVEMDEEAPNAEEENEDPGEGDVVESVPVSTVHTPDVKPRLHRTPPPVPVLKRSRTVPIRPRLAESYHSLFHPDSESFLHEDEDEGGKDGQEDYSGEDDGYDAEEESYAPPRTPSKARAVGFVAPIRQPPVVRNSLRPVAARERYTHTPYTHIIFV